METLFRYIAAPSRCGYLPQQTWRLEYEQVAEISPAEYMERMRDGWRRFGDMLFRPVAKCPHQPGRNQDQNRNNPDHESAATFPPQIGLLRIH